MRPPVQLGWSSGSRTGATGTTLVDDVEQILLDETVKVKCCGSAGQLQGRCGLVTADGVGLAYDVIVEAAAGWLVERGDRGDLRFSGLLDGGHLYKQLLLPEQ
jgi:hypothetical protein